MKTLRNHIILFDAECPLCKAYTKTLVSSGLMAEEGRAAYQEFEPINCPLFDRQRAVNEIALINQETGEVTYGIESLFKVFATAVPFLKPLFMFMPFVWLMSKVYAFVAYNRRVIVPPRAETPQQLQPEFRIGYRLAYLLFTLLVSGLILSKYLLLLNNPASANPYLGYLIFAGQILFQGVIVGSIGKSNLWNYLGNLMTVSIYGALLLLSALLPRYVISLGNEFYATWIAVVASVTFFEHMRRTKILKLGIVPVVSWALYYILVLLVVLVKSE